MTLAGREWLTLTEAEETFGVAVATWRRWISQGRIGSSKPGGRILLRRTEIEALLDRAYRVPDRKAIPNVRFSEKRVDPESLLAQLSRETKEQT